ncbi:hypothetical protein VTN00DRAFT_8899 [Thermoascus crustaceus]|uniref:uncharacterized protein n=1 Tax=Thermoascus crustaceus TaxID=5088 RepID=UPI003742260E
MALHRVRLSTPSMLLRASSRLTVRRCQSVVALTIISAPNQVQVMPQTTKAQAAPARTAPTIEIIKTPQNQGQQILARQRLSRPTSPHLGIYKWQITSVVSSLERITGIIFAGGLYVFSTAYFASPYLGWDLSSASMAAAFGALPVAVKAAAKFCVAWPFAFHCFNRAKYLVWSAGGLLTNRQVGWLWERRQRVQLR